jgi:hypothetical protein
MRDKHWTDEELLLMLFDVKERDERLDACPVCTRRLEVMRSRYGSRPSIAADVSAERLALQRAAVLGRLENKGKFHRILAPALASLFVLVIAVLLVFKPNAPSPPATESVLADVELEDAFQMSLSFEPEAIGPVQSLFEEPQ